MGVFEIGSDGVAGEVEFGVKPADSAVKTVELQAHKRAEAEADVVALRSGAASLAAFDRCDGGSARARKTVKNQHGDPRFLEQVQKCVAQRRALLGLDAPTLVAPVTPSGDPLKLAPDTVVVVQQLRIEMLNQRDYLDYLRSTAVENEVVEPSPDRWKDEPRADLRTLTDQRLRDPSVLDVP